MSDWAFVAVVALIVLYRIVSQWLDSRESGGETPPPGNDTLVETAYRDPVHDDGERSIPDIRLGFQKE